VRVVFSFSHSLLIFGGFYFVRIDQWKRKSILVIAIFFVRLMSGNAVFWWWLCLSLFWSTTQLILYVWTFVAAQWSLLTMKHKLVISLSPLLIHNATQKWNKISKNHDFHKKLMFRLNRNFKAKPSVASTVQVPVEIFTSRSSSQWRHEYAKSLWNLSVSPS